MDSRAVFFDLDGTLVHLDRPYESVTARTLKRHLGTSAPELIETYAEAFFAAFEALEPNPYRRGMETVLAMVDTDVDPKSMVATQHAAECAALTVDEAVPSVLEALGKETPLGVLTNGVGDWQRSKLDHVGLAPLFDTVVASYEAGAHKPATPPFTLAERRLPADEYVLVGDADGDVEGARAADWKGLRYEDTDEAPSFWTRLPSLL